MTSLGWFQIGVLSDRRASFTGFQPWRRAFHSAARAVQYQVRQHEIAAENAADPDQPST
jgi:hypothetical protein